MDVCDRVGVFIRERRLLRPGQLVVAAVSGGADSLCLLDCLHRLGYRIVLAHLDHRLREGSGDDAQFALEIARRYDLPAVVGREDVRALAGGRSLEEAARQARYLFLSRVAREHRCRVIATGHTSDDQAETVLLHLLRGAGPAGLAGMQPAVELRDWPERRAGRPLTVVRPLLGISRGETGAHCRARGLAPREDPTNDDPAFTRNRIRLELLPALETYNPGIRDVLARTARLQRDYSDLVDRLAREAWPETVRRAGKHALVFDARRLGRLPRALAGELVRRAVLSLGPEAHDFGLEDFDRVLRVTEGKPRRASIGSGLEAERIGEDLILRREGAPDPLPQFPQLTSPRPRRLRPGAAIRLAQGWRLALREVRLTEAVRRALLGNANPNLAAFDSRGLPEPLRLRPPIAGDRLRPLGLRGTKKVADLLIDRRIPRPARALWPVLVAGETPIWVVGLRQGGEGRLTPASKRALIVEATPPAP